MRLSSNHRAAGKLCAATISAFLSNSLRALGVIGLILPFLTRILPGLTPLAALGLSVIQVLAIPFHISRGEPFALPVNLTLLALSLFIPWGRWKKSPIAGR